MDESKEVEMKAQKLRGGIEMNWSWEVTEKKMRMEKREGGR